MRRILLATLAVLGLVLGFVAPVSADEPSPVDLAITVDDVIDPVLPGGTVVYKVVVTSNVAAPVPVEIDSTIEGGTLNATGTRVPPGCTTSATGVSCDAFLLSGTLTIYVAADVTGTSTRNVSSVAISPGALGFVESDPNNNSDTETTSVANESSTYLEQGERLTFEGHSLFVRESSTGVNARMADVAGITGEDCGPTKCADGLHVDYPENDVYTGFILLTVNFGTSDPCRGIGAPKCHALYYRTTADEPFEALSPCLTQQYRVEVGPCIEAVRKDGRVFSWDVRMDTNDPDLALPGLSG